MKTPEEIIAEMMEIMPFHMDKSCKPYIYEAMEVYANQFKPKEEFKYCIEVERESHDDDYTLHETFTQKMTEGEIIDWLHDYDHPYDPDYERLTFYRV